MSKTFREEKGREGKGRRQTERFYILWIIGVSLRLSLLSPPIANATWIGSFNAKPSRRTDLNMYASQTLTAASASCFFLAMLEAVLSRCFSRSLLNSKINEAIKQPPKVTITRLRRLPSLTRLLKWELSADFVLLFLLRSHVGLNNEPLDGEVENQRSHCRIKYGTRQELVGEVNREQIRLAGSV